MPLPHRVREPALALVLAFATAMLAAACGSEARTASGDVGRGKELFTQRCGSCHVLADAGTQGRVGPDLDQAFDDVVAQGFDESTIRDVVRGQISYAVDEPPTEAPGMPRIDELFPKCEDGQEPAEDACFTDPDDAADAVAAYVASVAGKTAGAQGGQQAGGAASSGEAIFASAGCGSCHTLAAADATGTIGPSFDESKPSLELALDRITNGKGQMPAFKGQLTEEQIRAVAEYVVAAARR